MDLKLKNMNNNFLISDLFLKYQSLAYLIIIFWAILISSFQSLFVIWKHIEMINLILFFVYFLIGLSSVIILIMQISRIYFSSDNSIKRRVWIVVNILLYYGVLYADLYLSTQTRF
ncbi:hypothetical protein OA88_20430 [Flavobacterium sp. JRM]|nr:hypothetical protein OA88_20430 [Flavobacterium sp. JRM]